MSKPKLNQPDVEPTTTIGGYSTPLSEYFQQMANKPNAIPKYAQITNQDLFIIIKAILWYNKSVVQMPSDKEIMKFIETHKEKIEDE